MSSSTPRHFEGLSPAQVLASRAEHGANIISPATEESLWHQLLHCWHYWLVKAVTLLWVGSTTSAIWLSVHHTGGYTLMWWLMPAIALVQLLVCWLVAFMGGKWEPATETEAASFEMDPLITILLAALMLGGGIAYYQVLTEGTLSALLEPLGIAIAVLLATGVAYLLERSNAKAFRSLDQASDNTPVKVVRQSNVCEVPRCDIVVGDIVLLSTGDEAPADCTIVESTGLMVNESMFTGEPETNKGVDPTLNPDAPYPANQLLKGSIVLDGTATVQVFAVGDGSEGGRLLQSVQTRMNGSTPLSRKLDQLALFISRAAYVIAALVVVGRMLSFFMQGTDGLGTTAIVKYLLDTILIAVSLIVVAVPEGLPMAVTMSLAFSMRQLMRQNTLPRTLHACETMGAVSVICTDKTGTLTQNRMQVVETYFPQADTLARVQECIAVNSSANLDFSHPQHPTPVGSPTEGALLLWLYQQGVDYRTLRESTEVLNRIPFSTEIKYMATACTSHVDGRKVVYATGAPDILLALCNEPQREAFDTLLTTYQHHAYRTLALAYAELSDEATPQSDIHPNRLALHMLGIVAISDPIRPDVPTAIRECREAGIDIKIITGDTIGTALEIGRQCGLWGDDATPSSTPQYYLGSDLETMSDETLKQALPNAKIIARARPADKERVVRMLKAMGHVVAVTGDGTNDAPALHNAHVGLSMGDGTAVAKEASDMTILDNSFATIAGSVMWGRSLYKNIQRFILFQLTVNVAACLVVMVGSFMGTESPLTVTQMLWVNLIMDTFAALALASLPPTHAVMHDRPRSISEHILHGAMGRILGVGTLFAALLIGLLLYLYHHDVQSISTLFHSAYNPTPTLSPYELTIFFTFFVMLQFWNMFNAKAYMTHRSAFAGMGWRATRWFISIALVILVGQVLIVELGGEMMGVSPDGLSFSDWLILTASTSAVLWVGEAVRLVHRRR